MCRKLNRLDMINGIYMCVYACMHVCIYCVIRILLKKTIADCQTSFINEESERWNKGKRVK